MCRPNSKALKSKLWEYIDELETKIVKLKKRIEDGPPKDCSTCEYRGKKYAASTCYWCQKGVQRRGEHSGWKEKGSK